MQLHDMTAAPNPRRVRIFLAEKGIDVDKVEIDITALVALDFAEYVGVAVPESLGNLGEWRARVSTRPSAQA